MPRFFRKSATATKSTRRVYKRSTKKYTPRRVSKAPTRTAYRAMRAVSSLKRKLDITPSIRKPLLSSYQARYGSTTIYPLQTITQNLAWVFPMTQTYGPEASVDGAIVRPIFARSEGEVHYKIAFMNLRLRFKNTTAADMIKMMIVYDRQPTIGFPYYEQPNSDTAQTRDSNLGLFMKNTIDSALFPNSRYKILYSKTKYLNPTTRPYCIMKYNTSKPFKIRNSTGHSDVIDGEELSQDKVAWDDTRKIPTGTCLTKGAIYAIIFTDNATYVEDTDEGDLEAGSFSFNYSIGVYDN